MSALCTMAAFLFTLTFTACGDDDDDDDDSDASTYEKEADGSINGYDYVDLGLSVVWATCNVGAASPELYGDYYAWGETETKSDYDSNDCETYGLHIDDIGGTDYDVAHVKWGGTWRMPTEDEIEELIDNCTFTWMTENGVGGLRFMSNKNGKSIFLPAAGYRAGTLLKNAGYIGDYWSSTPYERGTGYAYFLHFYCDNRCTLDDYREVGRSVRPVSE